MTVYDGEIEDFTAGDSLDIEREITSIPDSQTLTQAWFTVKRKYTDLDNQAVMQKVITAVSSASGIISDTGSDGTGVVLFHLLPADTLLLYPLSSYVYDIQVKTSGGIIHTVESGIITAKPQVTIATT